MDPDIIGICAATLTSTSFIPQVVRVLRTKDTRSISLSMYIIFNLGVATWLVYGLMLERFPIVIANAVTLSLTFTILCLKLTEGRRYRESIKNRDPDNNEHVVI